MRTSLVVLLAGTLVVSTMAVTLDVSASGTARVSPITSVWTEPASGYGFLDSAINGAGHSIDISMYEFSDQRTEADLIARARHGIDVRVLLNADYEGRAENSSAASMLTAGGVHVAWAPSDTIFHAKYVVVDARTAYVGTGNLVASDYPSTRDFWVEDREPVDVAAISSTFDADFAHQNSAPRGAGGLVWSPGSTSALVQLIDSANVSLLVENEEMDNASIERALMSAARRGVSVKVVMTYSSEWAGALTRLETAGVKVSTLSDSQIYIHAKVICADCTSSSGTVFIGSENFSVSSLVYNRELGIVTSSRAPVLAVERALHADFAQGTVAG